jgi:hypothetical protein
MLIVTSSTQSIPATRIDTHIFSMLRCISAVWVTHAIILNSGAASKQVERPAAQQPLAASCQIGKFLAVLPDTVDLLHPQLCAWHLCSFNDRHRCLPTKGIFKPATP